MAHDPRLPTIAIAGLAVVLLVALVGWSLLPARTSNLAAPRLPVPAATVAPAAIEVAVATVAPAAVEVAVATVAPAAVEVAKMPSPPEPVKIEMPPLSDAPVIAVQKTAPESPMYRVALAVAPWGEIYVNGKKVGVAPPMTELKLAPGKYSVEIRNSTFDAYREDIDVRNGSNVKIKHRFQ